MKLIFVGHRGVGKTALLQRIQIYLGRTNILPIFDLDSFIEKKYQKKISDIFETEGEERFRNMEIESFHDICHSESHFAIALGAGFPIKRISFPKDAEIIWIRRESDQLGRIFLDRPRLNPQLAPLEEFKTRALSRSENFLEYSSFIYDMPEGLAEPCEFERKIIFNEIQNLGGYLTLLPRHIKNLKTLLHRHFHWGIEKFELRDDILTENEIELIIPRLTKKKTLLSFRRPNSYELFSELLQQGFESDWAIELGPCSWTPSIYSLHDRLPRESLAQAVSRLEKHSTGKEHLKLAVPIANFEELKWGLDWQAADRENRSFLPRTLSAHENTKWKWVRLWLKGRQKINFICEGPGSSSDQPGIHEWLRCFSNFTHFAAVLGQPIFHSYSPIEHLNYFRARGMPFLAIDLSEGEWKSALPLLLKLGMKACAVTAPLKKLAYQQADEVQPGVETFKSLNTLFFADKVFGTNTDIYGFEKVIEGLHLPDPIVVWGGGGTLPILQQTLPKASYYSVRTSKPREGSNEMEPETLIWAAGPKDLEPLRQDWHPKFIIDLNYRDDSLARAYAGKTNAKYISGLLMFKAQALAQRNFWDQF